MPTSAPAPATNAAEPAHASHHRPGGVTLLAAVNAVAALLTATFWYLAFTRLPSPASLPPGPERMSAATTFGFGIADILWSLPLLVTAAAGLWKLKAWGWLAAQMTNALWWYSLTVLVVRDLFTQTVSPGTIVFLPFTAVAFWAAAYLWKRRTVFFTNETREAERSLA